MTEKKNFSLTKARNSKKIQYYFPQRKKLSKDITLIPPPISLELQLTSSCILRCKWCSHWKRNNFNSKDVDMLSWDTLHQIIQYIKKENVKGIYISGGGEPCLHPNIQKVVEELSQTNTKMALISNGVLFTRKLLEQAPLFSYLQISLISPDEQEYINNTGNKNAFNYMKNLPIEIKKRWKNSSPVIGAMFVISIWNYKNTFNAIDFCKQQGYDYCSFRLAIDLENRNVQLPINCLEFLRSELEKHSSIDENYTNLKQVLNHSETYPLKLHTECTNVSYGLYASINPKGQVYLCIPDVDNSQRSIGSLLDQPFEKIWNSDRHKQIIDLLNKRYCKGQCHKGCRSHGYNFALSSVDTGDYDLSHINFI